MLVLLLLLLLPLFPPRPVAVVAVPGETTSAVESGLYAPSEGTRLEEAGRTDDGGGGGGRGSSDAAAVSGGIESRCDDCLALETRFKSERRPED